MDFEQIKINRQERMERLDKMKKEELKQRLHLCIELLEMLTSSPEQRYNHKTIADVIQLR